jgi:cold shock CspA family protein
MALTGVIESFDDAAGLGVVRGDDGDAWPFHCVSIADGSRTIEVGARVSFDTRFHVARVEAVGIARV